MQTDLSNYMDINAVVIKQEIVDYIRKSKIELK
jgi:hypothetical protein